MPRLIPHRNGKSISNIVCPQCNGDTTVKDSRGDMTGSYVRRRRACKICTFRFTTIETIPIVEKSGRISKDERNVLVRNKVLRRTLGVLEEAGYFGKGARKQAEALASKNIR